MTHSGIRIVFQCSDSTAKVYSDLILNDEDINKDKTTCFQLFRSSNDTFSQFDLRKINGVCMDEAYHTRAARIFLAIKVERLVISPESEKIKIPDFVYNQVLFKFIIK